jgi:alpha-beta hydrolase superfamily lysophospholipase
MRDTLDCKVLTIQTPKKIQLSGLWFGPEKPKKAIIFVHGLGSSAFQTLIVPIVDQDTAVITFSNRGHDGLADFRKTANNKKGYTKVSGGVAHEVFADCVDDLQGVVNVLKEHGVNDIYLCGHSTGCQKSVYYLSRPNKQSLVKGVILLCPVSDYAEVKKTNKPEQLKKAQDYALKLVNEGKEHELLPKDIWPDVIDAQRFVSLYTPDSIEEIFTYSQPDKKPSTLQKVKIPTLLVFAEKDEYRDRPTKKMVEWFIKNMKTTNLSTAIVKNATHNFHMHEDEVNNYIKKWLDKGLF